MAIIVNGNEVVDTQNSMQSLLPASKSRNKYGDIMKIYGKYLAFRRF